jgi:hypothetical protein
MPASALAVDATDHARKHIEPHTAAVQPKVMNSRKTTMGNTRTEQAIDELDTDDDEDFDPSCDDIRLAWLAHESGGEHAGSHDFGALWSDR